jgi:AraC family transcriptional regulator, regulatory protein of adaptative response / methylated-DNA-[protein]-cysteine methyltransferase
MIDIIEAGSDSGRAWKSQAKSSIVPPAADRPVADRKDEIQFAVGTCSLGLILVAGSQKGICAILFGESLEALRRDLQSRFLEAELIGADVAFVALADTVRGFVEYPARGLDAPLNLRGTDFQQKVWRALCDIPAGTTTSYADIAGRVGAPQSARAVAQACAANPLAVAVPCHRVVRQDGSLSGYRWGVERKRALLARESVA